MNLRMKPKINMHTTIEKKTKMNKNRNKEIKIDKVKVMQSIRCVIFNLKKKKIQIKHNTLHLSPKIYG